jgi:hypothetical protein
LEECAYFWGVNTSWGINMVEKKIPLNEEDNQPPQPTIFDTTGASSLLGTSMT